MRRHVKIDAKAILSLIKNEGYKIGEFAEELHISYRTLKRYFDDQRMPIETYNKTARLLHVQSETLIQPPPQDREGDDLKRRDFIQLSIATTLTDMDIWDRLALAIKQPKKVDAKVIENLESIKQYCYHLLPVIADFTSHESERYTRRHLDTIIHLLSGCPIKYSMQLSSIAAEFAVIVGCIESANGERNKARLSWASALELALQAENKILQATIQARGALSLIHDGQALRVLESLQHARTLATSHAATPLTQAWLAAAEAEARANIGNEQACLAALEVAELELQAPSEDPYFTTFNKELLKGYQGTCYLHLGQLQNAERVFLDIIREKPQNSEYTHSFILSDLAKLYLLDNEKEQACFYIEKMARTAINTASPKIAKRVLNLRGKIQEDLSPLTTLDELIQGHKIFH